MRRAQLSLSLSGFIWVLLDVNNTGKEARRYQIDHPGDPTIQCAVRNSLSLSGFIWVLLDVNNTGKEARRYQIDHPGDPTIQCAPLESCPRPLLPMFDL
jgi:hypothetical protein